MNPYQAISTIMTSKPVTVLEIDTFYHIQQLFNKHEFHHLIVINKDEVVTGMISRIDMANVYGMINHLTIGGTYTEQALKTLQAKSIMTSNPAMLSPEDTIGFAADIFLVNRFHALPIVEDDCLVGILTTHDLLKFGFDKIPITE